MLDPHPFSHSMPICSRFYTEKSSHHSPIIPLHTEPKHKAPWQDYRQKTMDIREQEELMGWRVWTWTKQNRRNASTSNHLSSATSDPITSQRIISAVINLGIDSNTDAPAREAKERGWISVKSSALSSHHFLPLEHQCLPTSLLCFARLLFLSCLQFVPSTFILMSLQDQNPKEVRLDTLKKSSFL